MKRAALIAVLLSLLAPGACTRGGPETDEALAAFEAFIDALDRADPAALWALSDQQTRKAFDDLAADLKDAQEIVDRHYPEADRAAARKNLLGDIVRPDTTGERLFMALLDPRKISAPKDPAARAVERVVAGPESVRVMTESGDAIEFTREPDGALRTGVLLRALQEVPALGTLRENVAAVRQNRDLIERTPPAREKAAPAKGGQS